MKVEFHLVIGFDSSSDGLKQTILEIVRSHAQEIDGAVHLAHRAVDPSAPQPELHLYADDFIMGRDEIGVKEQGDADKS